MRAIGMSWILICCFRIRSSRRSSGPSYCSKWKFNADCDTSTQGNMRRKLVFMKPAPPPTPEEARQLALAVIAADRFPMLASIDGDQPRVRPVSPVRTDVFTVYVASMRRSHKTGEIEANAKIELCYLS